MLTVGERGENEHQNQFSLRKNIQCLEKTALWNVPHPAFSFNDFFSGFTSQRSFSQSLWSFLGHTVILSLTKSTGSDSESVTSGNASLSSPPAPGMPLWEKDWCLCHRKHFQVSENLVPVEATRSNEYRNRVFWRFPERISGSEYPKFPAAFGGNRGRKYPKF